MHNPESALENETHKLPWDFAIQKNQLISARQSDLLLVKNKKRTCRMVDFAAQVDHGVKLKESENENKYLNLARELKKTMEHESDGDISSN